MKRSIVTGMTLFGLTVAGSLVIWSLRTEPALAHCQVPCGIYDDGGRITMLKEDATTIAKAIAQINELANKNDAQSQNQLARWIMTKEAHASHIIEVMSEYFLAQRVKPGDDRDAYLAKLAEHHAVIVSAMKTKQTADASAVSALNDAIDGIAEYYHSH